MNHFINNTLPILIFINLIFGLSSKFIHTYFLVKFRGNEVSSLLDIYNVLLKASFLTFEKAKNEKEKNIVKVVNFSSYIFIACGAISAIIITTVILVNNR